MIEAILAEAIENGADEFFELPGFEQALYGLRDTGEIGIKSIEHVFDKAPETSNRLAIVVQYNIAEERLADAQLKLASSRVDLENSRVELENSRVDLEKAQETKRILQDAVNATKDN